MAKRVLVVTKDIMDFEVYNPIASRLLKLGVCVNVVAEGLSMNCWEKSGTPIFGGLPSADKIDQGTLMRHDLDPDDVITVLKPDIILTGLANPIHLGESFGLAANQQGIPLGFVEDLWGSHKRSKAVPNFVCTIDYIAEDTARASYRDYQKHFVDIQITGNPAMDRFAYLVRTPRMGRLADMYPRIVLLSGQGEATTPLVEGLIAGLDLWAERLQSSYLLMVRFHPKTMRVYDDARRGKQSEQSEKLKSHVEVWQRMLRSAKRGDVMVPAATMMTEEIIGGVDEVASICSNTLIEAIAARKLAVSWNSELGEAQMKKSFGYASFPLVQQGACVEAWTPEEYYAKVPTRESLLYENYVRNASRVVPAGENTENVISLIMR
jgi:hypothetical protein